MLPRQGDPTFPFGFSSLSVLLALDLLCFRKNRLAFVFSKERLRGKDFSFSRSILCFSCLGSWLNGLRKGFCAQQKLLSCTRSSVVSLVHPSDHPVCDFLQARSCFRSSNA